MTTTTSTKKLAKKRLAETGNRCDGCQTTIGRWTKQCYYDARYDRVYCSVNGCANQITGGSKCSNCGQVINTFEHGAEPLPTSWGPVLFCKTCWAKLDNSEIDLPRSVLGYDSLDEDDVYYLSKGPYYVTQQGFSDSPVYQVVRDLLGGKVFVRSVLGNEEMAYGKCADFNRVEDGAEVRTRSPVEPAANRATAPRDTSLGRLEGPWVFIRYPEELDKELPRHWTRSDSGEIKTRVGTARYEQIKKWFKKRGHAIK